MDEMMLEYNQCEEAVKRLNDYLSRELAPDEEDRVQQHLAECRGCFAKFAFEETLLRTIREKAERITAPASLRHKILGLLHTEG
ncbi:MAG: zf-HC2 domain-containing protein [Armatimonas sp.]